MTLHRPPDPSHEELHALAARVLVRTAWVAAGLLLLTALANEALGEVTRFSRLRGGFGLLLAVAAAAGQWPLAARPRLACAVVLASAVLGAWVHAWVSGVGLHAMVLMAALLVVLLSGLLCSALTAVLFAAVNAVAALATFAAERQGLLQGLTAAQDLQPGERLLGLLLLIAVSLMCALLLVRVLQASLGRAAEHEQRLAQLVRIGSDWTWEMDEQGLMTYISPSFEPRTGRTVAEFMQTQRPGGPVIIDDEHYQLMLQHMRRREAWRDCTITVRCADGTEVVVNGSGEPVTDARGRFTGWRGASRNVTHEIRTQRLLDRLVTLSPDPICVLRDRDGVIQRVNPAFQQRVGLQAEQIVGFNHRQLGLWNDPPNEARVRADLRRHGVVRDLRFDWKPPGQPARPTLLSAVRFESGGEQVVVATTRDIGEVERARAEAEAASRAKSAFLATMSHEIRTPLNGVLGLAHLMQDASIDATRRDEYLGHLVQAAEQLSGIVSDVLDLSKIEAGHLQI
ncbi:MAG: PAS domain S-box protein, partial [Rubrivivax sp.]|nr:PAS domain S-box protein [Rubrivivax sp.]